MADRTRISPEAKGEIQEAKDQLRAERGDRIAKFIRGEPVGGFWESDLLPILDRIYWLWQRRVVAKEADPDALQALEDVVNVLDGERQMGAGAMRRIMERRLGGGKG